jgi:hypothetical protein
MKWSWDEVGRMLGRWVGRQLTRVGIAKGRELIDKFTKKAGVVLLAALLTAGCAGFVRGLFEGSAECVADPGCSGQRTPASSVGPTPTPTPAAAQQ